MKKQIRIGAGIVELQAQLNDTRTARAFWEILPLKGKANTWGEEIYFPIPLKLEIENGRRDS